MKIKLVAVSKIGKEHGLYVRAVEISNGIYATGQGIIPNDSSTSNNLTYKEMIGEDKLSEEKMKRFPFIINPHDDFKIPDGFIFDLDDVESKAKYDLVVMSAQRLAMSKDKFNRQKHSFYLQDKVKESKAKVSSYKATFKAGNMIERLSTEELQDLADYLYIYKNESRCSRKIEVDVVVSTIYEYATKTPSVIIEALAPENKLSLKISKYIIKGILMKKGADFYEGKVFIASSFDKLIEHYKSDMIFASRVDSKYESLKNNIHATFNSPEINASEIKADFLQAILLEDKDELKLQMKLIKNSGDAKLNSLMTKMNEKIGIIFNPIKTIHKGADYDIDKSSVVSKETIGDLLSKIASVHFSKVSSEFKKLYPNSELTKKEEIEKFLNEQKA